MTSTAPTTSHSEEEPSEATTRVATTSEGTTAAARTTAATTSESLGPCEEAGCEHLCRVVAGGTSAECVCHDGYILAQDGKTCDDIDECSDGSNGGCGSYCRNLAGSYECLCRDGFVLDTDGKICLGND